ILHPGHLFLLNEAKKMGDSLTVIIARDHTVQTVKNITSQNNEQVRLKNLQDLNIADKVMLGNPGDKYEVIRNENPEVIALGYDQTAFTADLEKVFPNIKIIRLPPYKEDIYKSSKFRDK
ncbi:MAG: adenylyltransferase/cytidyltransferase family protein, partial [Candidatus Magasanikbacteria bacterium]|nr:adenylyltransferase/cytidyltransferase family protein [Candidatus Magasanikbacteria bacterium]